MHPKHYPGCARCERLVVVVSRSQFHSDRYGNLSGGHVEMLQGVGPRRRRRAHIVEVLAYHMCWEPRSAAYQVQHQLGRVVKQARA